MKTVGELLVNARTKKGITIEELSLITKIDPNHLTNLENNNFAKLPSATFIKGFIRNVASALGENPNELIAVFRRDFKTPKTSPNLITADKFKSKKIFQFSPQTSVVIFVSLVFIFYLGIQLRAYIIPPRLKISQPQANAVVNSPVIIEGKTDPNSIIQINQEVPISPDTSGYFISNLLLSPKETELIIISTNRFGRATKRTIPITVISP